MYIEDHITVWNAKASFDLDCCRMTQGIFFMFDTLLCRLEVSQAQDCGSDARSGWLFFSDH